MLWNAYVRIYVLITLAYLWYRFFLLFLTELKMHKKKRVRYNQELLSVIVPFYNEDPTTLKKTIASVLNAKGNKELIVVDDGSPDPSTYETMKQAFPEATIIRLKKNVGKRHAQHAALKKATGTYVITIDSDTIIQKNALINLVKPLITDPQVGATTGNVGVLNWKDNLLTRMITARYWNAFNIERKSLSGFGIVTCCSGVLSAYRLNLLKQLMPAYLNQEFLGKKCTYGDDRYLTNLVLMRNLKIEYVENAKCSTAVPQTYWQFIKQQLRWKKSFLRESWITLKYAFKHSIILPIEVLFNLIIPFWSLLIRLSILLSIILYPHLIFFFASSVIIVACIRNFFIFIEKRKYAIYTIPYAFVHEFILFWLYFVALFTLNETSWGTR